MHCDHQESTQSWSGKPRRGHRGAVPLILCQSGGGGGGRVTDNLTTVNHDNTPILWLVPTFLGKDHHWGSSVLSSLSLSVSLATVNEVVFLSEEGYDESSMMLTILMVMRRKSKTYVIMMMMMMMMMTLDVEEEEEGMNVHSERIRR